MLTSLISTLVLCLTLPALAEHHKSTFSRRHSGLAKRASGDVHLYKRFSNTKWTFYDVEVGLGACGHQNKDTDFTVALNSAQYGGGYPGPHCFQTITMRYNGKTATATVMDECPGCPYGGLDLTRGLFSYFDSQDKGIIYGEWWFGSEGGDSKPTTTKKTTTRTTSTWTPPTTTSTWEAPTTTTTKSRTTSSHTSTSTPTPPTTSSSIASTSSTTSEASITSSEAATSTSASAANFASGPASGLAVPTGTISTTPGEPHNINALNVLFIQIGGMVIAGANVVA